MSLLAEQHSMPDGPESTRHPLSQRSRDDRRRGAESDGNFKQDEDGPSLRLCLSYQGCEGRSEAKHALTKLGLVRNKGTCPSSMSSGSRVWQVGSSFNGDLNKDMWSGGKVHLCEQNEKGF